MKRIILAFSLSICALVFSIGCDGCDLSALRSEFNPKSLSAGDLKRYTVKLTKVAVKTAKEEQLHRRGIFALESEKAGEKRFPAFVTAMSGVVPLRTHLTDSTKITGVFCDNDVSVSEVRAETKRMLDIFDNTNASHRVVLRGVPGIDMDARVYAFADRLAHGCGGVSKEGQNREVVSIDFETLSSKAKEKKVSQQTYLAVAKAIVDEFSKDTIFYVTNIKDVEGKTSGAGVNALLDLFLLDEKIKVIIGASPELYASIFARPKMRSKLSLVKLHDLTAEELKGYLNEVKKAEADKEEIAIDEDVIENIARLTAAFVPGMPASEKSVGLLGMSMNILTAAIEEAKASADKAVNSEMVNDAVSVLTKARLSLVRKSDAVALGSDGKFKLTLGEVSVFVDEFPEYFVRQEERESMAKQIHAKLAGRFDEIISISGDVKKAVQQLSGADVETIAEGLTALDIKLKEAQDKIERGNVTLELGILPVLNKTKAYLKAFENAIKEGNAKLAGPILTGLNGMADGLVFVEDALNGGNDFLAKQIKTAVFVLDAHLYSIKGAVDSKHSYVLDDLKPAVDRLEKSLTDAKKRFEKDGDVENAFTSLKSAIDTEMLAALMLLKTRFSSGGEYAEQVASLKKLAEETANGSVKELVARFESSVTKGDIVKNIELVDSAIDSNIIAQLKSMQKNLTPGGKGIADQIGVLSQAHTVLGARLTTLLKKVDVDKDGNLRGDVQDVLDLVETAVSNQVLQTLTELRSNLTLGKKGVADQVNTLKQANTVLGGRLDNLLTKVGVDEAGELIGTSAGLVGYVETAMDSQVLQVLGDVKSSLTAGKFGVGDKIEALRKADVALGGRLFSLLQKVNVDSNGNLAGSAEVALAAVETAVENQIIKILSDLHKSLSVGEKGVADQVLALKEANTKFGGRLTALSTKLSVDSDGNLSGDAENSLRAIEKTVDEVVLKVLAEMQTTLTEGKSGIVDQLAAVKTAKGVLGGRFDSLLEKLNVNEHDELTGSISDALAPVEDALEVQVLNVLASLKNELTAGNRGVAGQVSALNTGNTALKNRLAPLVEKLHVNDGGELKGSISDALTPLEGVLDEQVLTVMSGLKNELTTGNQGVAGQVTAIKKANTALGGRLASLVSKLNVDDTGKLTGEVGEALTEIESAMLNQVLMVLTEVKGHLLGGESIVGEIGTLKKANTALSGRLSSLLASLTGTEGMVEKSNALEQHVLKLRGQIRYLEGLEQIACPANYSETYIKDGLYKGDVIAKCVDKRDSKKSGCFLVRKAFQKDWFETNIPAVGATYIQKNKITGREMRECEIKYVQP